MPEEPDEGNPHVRVCGGRRGCPWLMRAIQDGRTPEKIKDNLQKLAGRSERIRMTEYEE